jgi:hypothetical protein
MGGGRVVWPFIKTTTVAGALLSVLTTLSTIENKPEAFRLEQTLVAG